MKGYAKPRVKVSCNYCGKPTPLNSRYTYQKVAGFVPRRSGGGANQVVLREPMQVFACEGCITRMKAGAKVDQLSLDELGEQLSL